MSVSPGRPPLSRRALLIGAVLSTVAAAACGTTPDDSARSRTAVIALIQEPGLLSPMFSTQSGSDLTSALVVEPLFLTRADGTREPYLAAELPTLANGGLSADGRTVTYRLRPDVTWSDGTPLTAKDMAFTVAVAQNPDGVARPEPEYATIEATTVVDDRTLAVTMKAPQPGYLNLFQQILPAHAFTSPAVQADNPQARLPMGTGPFVYEDWRSGDQITLVANKKYWRNPAQPALAGINVKITPEKQAAISGFLNGEYDSVYFLTAGDLADVDKAKRGGAPIELAVDQRPGSVEWLWLNHSAGGDLTKPHPVLGDPAIREAIDAGINRQAIIDNVLGGFGKLSGSLLYAGFGAVPAPPTAYDPAHASAVLDKAGWVRGADGIRSRGGVRATLRYQTISGDQTRALYQQIVQQDMKAIGIELAIQNVPSNSLFDSRSKNGMLATGNFDVAMSRDGRYPDPAEWVATFSTARIPTDASPIGFSYSFWSDKRFDDLVRQQSTAVDPTERKRVLGEINTEFGTQRVAIPLYGSASGYAWSTALKHVDVDFWDGLWTPASSAAWAFEG